MDSPSNHNDMEKEKLESLLIDYIDGKLSEEDRAKVDQLLTDEPDVRRTYDQLREVIQAMGSTSQWEPSSSLRKGFEELLEQEGRIQSSGKVVRMYPVFNRVAAAVLLVVMGGGIGYWISQQRAQAVELEAVRREMAATKHMLMTMLDNQQSASQRLMGATVAFNDFEKADDEIANALVHTMNTDENTNVRMAALEALEKFYRQPHVRKALIASLNTQDDPVVQIALIRLMVEMKEKGVTRELERITDDEDVLPAVKDEAHVGLLKLI